MTTKNSAAIARAAASNVAPSKPAAAAIPVLSARPEAQSRKRLRGGLLILLALLALGLTLRPIFDVITQPIRPAAPAAPYVDPVVPAPAAPDPVSTAPTPRPAVEPPAVLAPSPVFAQFRTWDYGNVVGETVAGATCTLDARFEDGSAIPARAISQPKVAGSDGLVSWSYSPPYPGTNDNGTYVLTCTRDGHTDRSTRDFDLGST